MPAHTTLATVPAGGDLPEALVALGAAGPAWINATGEVEAVELKLAGDGGTRALRGAFSLLHLAGPSQGPFSVVLARASDVGIEVVGGVLVRARSAGVAVVLHASEMREPLAPTWASAVAVSARVDTAEEEDDAEEASSPEAGDLVDHFAFGLCEVLTSDGERLRIRDVKPPHRIREVSMEMLKVMPPTESEGKRLFRLSRRGT